MSIILSPGETLYLQTYSTPGSTARALVSYVDIGTNVTGSAQVYSSATTINANICNAPGSDAKRCIKNILFESGPNTITAKFSISSSAGLCGLYTARLLGSQTVNWTDGFGWQRNDARGNLPVEPPRNSDTQIFNTTGSFTWTKPTSFTPRAVYVLMWAGGGGGGGGYSAATGSNRIGGGGGGGGAFNYRIIPASELPSTVTVTVGSGGLGGVGGNATTAPTTGSAGGFSSFGEYLFAYGGGGGSQGSTNFSSGGGGGGIISSGGVGPTNSSTGGSAGEPYSYSSTAAAAWGVTAGTGDLPSSTYILGVEFSGGGGGSYSSSRLGGMNGVGIPSIYGGAGGASGGGYSGGGSAFNGGAGGGNAGNAWGYGSTYGGGYGVIPVSPAGAGGNGTSGTWLNGGGGGGGGGPLVNTVATGSGGAGGAGGARGGGGGGGGTGNGATNVGGNGGPGGRGEVIVVTW